MSRARLLAVLLAVLLAPLLTGLLPGLEAPSAASPSGSPAGEANRSTFLPGGRSTVLVRAAYPLVLTDALGDTVRLAAPPRRIISLSPNLTEALFALGVDSSRIAGVTRFCDTPPEARRRPVIGGILDPSLEAIQMRRPDLVLAARGNPLETLARMRSLGFPVFAFEDQTSCAGVLKLLTKLAQLTAPEDSARAAALLRSYAETLDAYETWSAGVPRRPSVFYTDPEHPGWTCGPGSHVDDLIRLAGASNIVREGGAWPQFSGEKLLMEDPDRLVLALPEGWTPERARRALDVLPSWPHLTAMREGRICWIPSGELLRPGPRLMNALGLLASCLHPEPDRRPPKVGAPHRGSSRPGDPRPGDPRPGDPRPGDPRPGSPGTGAAR